jgi:hypothetical protein
MQKVTETNIRIQHKFLEVLTEDTQLNLSPSAIVQKRITWQNPTLDRRTSILFKNVLFDVYMQAKEMGILLGLLQIGVAVNDGRVAGQFMKETSLPFVRELVTSLDTIDPNILNEATTDDISADMEQFLQKAHLA